jgi:hypothetical protein
VVVVAPDTKMVALPRENPITIILVQMELPTAGPGKIKAVMAVVVVVVVADKMAA